MVYALVRYNEILLFDENLKLKEKKPIELDEKDLLEIKQNKLPEKVKSVLPQDIIFIGQRFEGYNTVFDIEKIRAALEHVDDSKIDKYQQILVKVTVNDISKSITRDLLVIQAVYLLDDLNKILNLLMERFREWYELYLPEISKQFEDHEKFIELVCCKTREELMEKYGIDITMGGELTEKDVNTLNEIAKRIKELYTLRAKIREYISDLMDEVAPNLKKIAGPVIGARLISLAGGLKELAMLPSSTIQVLGAEKALFRHLRKGTPPPKHGVIFNHPLIQKLPRKFRGAMARTLASKISIAAKVDAYSPGRDISEELLKVVKERFEQLKQGIKGKEK